MRLVRRLWRKSLPLRLPPKTRPLQSLAPKLLLVSNACSGVVQRCVKLIPRVAEQALVISAEGIAAAVAVKAEADKKAAVIKAAEQAEADRDHDRNTNGRWLSTLANSYTIAEPIANMALALEKQEARAREAQEDTAANPTKSKFKASNNPCQLSRGRRAGYEYEEHQHD